MFEFLSAFETGNRAAQSLEGVKNGGKAEGIDPFRVNEWSEAGAKAAESVEALDTGKYMLDDIGLHEKTSGFDEVSRLEEIRAQIPKVDEVLGRMEQSLEQNPSDINYQRVMQTIEQYKGTIFEHELKEALGANFETVEAKQQVVETELGGTKPDVVLRDALEDMKIGDLEVGKGEDLMIEAKCGSADYIRSEMPHILRQVEGHEGANSLVVVTRDYLDLSPEVRANFEKLLAEKGSHIYVADVSSFEMSDGVRAVIQTANGGAAA